MWISCIVFFHWVLYLGLQRFSIYHSPTFSPLCFHEEENKCESNKESQAAERSLGLACCRLSTKYNPLICKKKIIIKLVLNKNYSSIYLHWSVDFGRKICRQPPNSYPVMYFLSRWIAFAYFSYSVLLFFFFKTACHLHTNKNPLGHMPSAFSNLLFMSKN